MATNKGSREGEVAEELEEEGDSEDVVSQNQNGRNLVQCKATKEINGEKKEATVYLDLGQTASEMISLYGDETVKDLAVRSAKIKAQAQIRADLEAGKTQEQITEAFKTWNPKVQRTATKDPVQAILGNFGNLDPEAKAQVLAQLRESLKG